MSRRYPENSPMPYWLKLYERYIPTARFARIPISKVAVSGTLILLGLSFYAVAIQPKINHEYYDKIQKETYSRLSLTREEQANGLRPWSDPFDRK